MQYVTMKSKKKEISILMFGDTHCGKTSIIRRLIEDEYIENDYLFSSGYNKELDFYKTEFRYTKPKHMQLGSQLSNDKELPRGTTKVIPSSKTTSELPEKQKNRSTTSDSDDKTSPEIDDVLTNNSNKIQDDFIKKKKKKTKCVIFNITERSLSTCNDFNSKSEGDIRVDMIVLCYPVCSPPASSNVVVLWRNYLNLNHPTTPIILVATKIDLRHDPDILETLKVTGQTPVEKRKGQQISEMMNCVAFIECSAKYTEGIYELFVAICMQYKKLKQGNILKNQLITNSQNDIEPNDKDSNHNRNSNSDISISKLSF